MNDRIKELYKQAVDYAYEGVNPNNGWKNGKDFAENVNEKFAELIVRECGYCADIFEAAGCPVDMDPTETKPSDYIKRQMGIE